MNDENRRGSTSGVGFLVHARTHAINPRPQPIPRSGLLDCNHPIGSKFECSDRTRALSPRVLRELEARVENFSSSDSKRNLSSSHHRHHVLLCAHAGEDEPYGFHPGGRSVRERTVEIFGDGRESGRAEDAAYTHRSLTHSLTRPAAAR